MKTCTVCRLNLSYNHYHKSKKSKDGYGYRCRDCDRKARESYRENNKERFAEVNRRKLLKYKFGITPEDFDSMFESQGKCCAICKSTDSNTSGKKRPRSWSVDHCHHTGKIRGILCNRCNGGLGMFMDDPTLLKKATEYLYDTH